MALKDWGFIFFGDDYHPEKQNSEFSAGGMRTRIAGVGSIDKAVEVARDWASQGVQLIELCGWFDSGGAEHIVEAVGETVAVGVATPMPETRHLYAALFG